MYAWNMEFNEDDDIKGDFSVITRGSTALLMKELKTQSLIMLSQSLTDDERLYIKTGNFLKEKIKMLINDDLADFIHTDEEVDEIRKNMQDSEAIDLAKKLQQAEIVYTIAKAKHMDSKATATDKQADLDVIDKVVTPIKEQQQTDAEHARKLELLHADHTRKMQTSAMEHEQNLELEKTKAKGMPRVTSKPSTPKPKKSSKK